MGDDNRDVTSAWGSQATYRFSSQQHPQMASSRFDSPSHRSNFLGHDGRTFVRGSTWDRQIAAVAIPATAKPERPRDYKGGYRRWPGLLLFLVLIGGASSLIVTFGVKARNESRRRAKAYEDELFGASRVKGGRNGSLMEDLVSDDGAIGNPKKYPPSTCELPNYLSKNGQIVAVSKNGTEVNLKIKGINWFGMETGQAIPLGLWENNDNGTTAYQIAAFLARNKFNGVRFPVMAQSLLENTKPNTKIINKSANRALNADNYMSLLKSILKTLQFRNIGVLISMHTLTLEDNGKLWYSDAFPQEKFLQAIDILTKELCTKEYWNVMGVDLKNEPWAGSWGDGKPNDFRLGAKLIADRMLKGCPNWMGFVEGVNAFHTVDIDGETFRYYDWYGGGLQGAKTHGLDFAIKDKVVWAPHYYNPGVFPQMYLYGGGKSTPGSGKIEDFVELSDEKLRRRVKATMDDMFGFLASETGPALLLGEFGGLYATDKHPKKTTQRCTDYTMEVIKSPGWAGGFVWCLNPESEYQYNPADTPGKHVEGVLTLDWLGANEGFLKGLEAMDDMPNLRPFPCFKET